MRICIFCGKSYDPATKDSLHYGASYQISSHGICGRCEAALYAPYSGYGYVLEDFWQEDLADPETSEDHKGSESL